MRWARTRVLPEPAPARMSSGPSVVVTARACSGFSAWTISASRAARRAASGLGSGARRRLAPAGSRPGPSVAASRSHSGSSGARRGPREMDVPTGRGAVLEVRVGATASGGRAHPAILGRRPHPGRPASPAIASPTPGRDLSGPQAARVDRHGPSSQSRERDVGGDRPPPRRRRCRRRRGRPGRFVSVVDARPSGRRSSRRCRGPGPGWAGRSAAGCRRRRRRGPASSSGVSSIVTV